MLTAIAAGGRFLNRNFLHTCDALSHSFTYANEFYAFVYQRNKCHKLIKKISNLYFAYNIYKK